MRARNDREREVEQLFPTLPKLTDKQERYAIDKCFDKVGYVSKQNVWCTCCSKSFPAAPTVASTGTAKCPWCGEPLKLEKSRKTKEVARWYYSIVTTCKGWQVFRHFVAEKWTRKDYGTFYSVKECVQNWLDAAGHEVTVARSTHYVPYVYDAWNWDKPMAIKDRRRQYSYNPDKYDVDAAFTYPRRALLPIIKRNGFTGRCKTLSAFAQAKLLLTDREAEVLAKNGQYALLGWKWAKGYKEFCMPFAHSIRIASKHGYIVKDASMWMDYLDLLGYFHLDTHNAHYVCPDNLKEVHDHLLARKKRAEERKAAEERRKDAAKWEKIYHEEKARFFGVCFGNEHITVTVIKSVQDMADEGKAMHHCVYDMGYYKKSDSLILTARDTSGKRIETIEVSLKTFSVVQSRGVCNKNTEYHEEIIQLVNDNINLIRQAA